VKNATKFWVCEKVKDWLIEDATLGANELQRRIKDDHKVMVHYKRVYMSKQLALHQLYGDWDCSFDNLYRFKAAIEKSSPGSLVLIDHHTIQDKIRFRRSFFALKPCIDGFLTGCRPYLAIDNTFLTCKFKGQLGVVVAVDGHNWTYPVAFVVMDSETNKNWIWFMQRLRDAIYYRSKPTDGRRQATREPGGPEPLSVGPAARMRPEVEVRWACHLTYTWSGRCLMCFS
jgi:hypothetical protein